MRTVGPEAQEDKISAAAKGRVRVAILQYIASSFRNGRAANGETTRTKPCVPDAGRSSHGAKAPCSASSADLELRTGGRRNATIREHCSATCLFAEVSGKTRQRSGILLDRAP